MVDESNQPPTEPRKRPDRREHVTCELRAARHYDKGLTQEDIAAATGLARATIQAIERGEPVKPFTAEIVRKFAADLMPIHWPRHIHKLFQQYKRLESTLPKNEFKQYLDTLEVLLLGQRALDSEGLEAAGYLWLLTWIDFDRVMTFKEEPELLKRAMSRFERIIPILTMLVDSKQLESEFLLAKAKLTQWVFFYAGEPQETRVKDPRVIQWIKDNKLLEAAYICAEHEPFEWSGLRNGLVVASIVRRRRDCNAIRKLLIRAHPGFADLNFIPAKGVLPLSKNTDLAFFLSDDPGDDDDE